MENPGLDKALVRLLEDIGDVGKQADRKPEPDIYRKGWRDAIYEILVSKGYESALTALKEAGWTAPRNVWAAPKTTEETDD